MQPVQTLNFKPICQSRSLILSIQLDRIYRLSISLWKQIVSDFFGRPRCLLLKCLPIYSCIVPTEWPTTFGSRHSLKSNRLTVLTNWFNEFPLKTLVNSGQCLALTPTVADCNLQTAFDDWTVHTIHGSSVVLRFWLSLNLYSCTATKSVVQTD